MIEMYERFKEVFIKNKKLLFFLGITIIIVITLILFFYFDIINKINSINSNLNNKIEEKILNEDKEVLSPENEEQNYIYVDIKGEIKKPGTYKMTKDDRVIDVIEKAGGLTSNASTKANNLSKKLIDEMVIIIYSKNEINEFSKTKEKEEQLIINCNNANNNYNNNNSSCISKIQENNNEKTSKVSINKASKEELMTINGVGESKAESIIKYRTEIGLFKTLEELKEVSGIGESLYDKIKDYITL